MKVKKKVPILLVLVFLVGILSIALPIAPVGASPASPSDWSVQYMIDQSQTVSEKSQFSGPRDNRGLALSPDGQYLYAGYNNPGSASPGYHMKQVRKIDTTVADYTSATVAILQGDRGKAIAVDDQGRVYLAEGSDTDTKDGSGIHIYDADLSTKLLTIPPGAATGLSKPEGVAVTREAGQLVLYVTDRTLKTLNRFLITEGPPWSATKDPGATYPITIGAELRGVEVDPAGRIWMAGYDAKKVFRVNSDGTGLVSTTVDVKPMDIGFSGGQAFVTQYTTRTITVLNQDDLSVVETLTPPWASLELDPDGQSGNGALSGIAVASGAIYVANEAGQTANEHSTYGRTDGQSGYIDDKFYTDLTHDDNEPILKMITLLCVSIDVKPGSYPNSINLKSNGVVPVAVLTTDGFDAGTVNPNTILFAGASPAKWSLEDVNGDTKSDLVLHFKTEDLIDLTSASTEATLTGSTYGGIPIKGIDTVNIVPKK